MHDWVVAHYLDWQSQRSWNEHLGQKHELMYRKRRDIGWYPYAQIGGDLYKIVFSPARPWYNTEREQV